MTLRDYVRLLRENGLGVLACLVLGLAASAGLTALLPREYTSTTILFMTPQVPVADPGDLVDVNELAEQRLRSYELLVNSTRVADEVVQTLQLGMTADELAGRINPTAMLDTVVLEISVVDEEPTRSALIANTVAEAFIRVATQLEQPSAGAPGLIAPQIAQPAAPPLEPSAPDVVRNVVLGGLLGLLVGVLAAVLRHALDVSVRSAGLLRRQVGAPTLGVITRNASMGKRPLVVHADPKGSQAEQFRQLRTALQFTNVHRHRKVFLIVSPLSDEGRTATACNLGIALVDAGSRVLLIEADLRHPRAADYLGLDPSIGLTTVLAGDVRLQEAVQRWGENPLEFLASGDVPFNPSELLGSRAMTALLEEARRRYDVVLVDTPPLMPFTDAAAVAPSTDGAILVVRYGRTRRDQVAASVSALEAVSAPVLGSVITMAPGKRGDTFADYSVTSHDGRQDERRQPAAPGRYVAQEPPPDWRPPPPVRAAGVPQRMASTPARPSPVPRQRMHDFDVPDAAS